MLQLSSPKTLPFKTKPYFLCTEQGNSTSEKRDISKTGPARTDGPSRPPTNPYMSLSIPPAKPAEVDPILILNMALLSLLLKIAHMSTGTTNRRSSGPWSAFRSRAAVERFCAFLRFFARVSFGNMKRHLRHSPLSELQLEP